GSSPVCRWRSDAAGSSPPAPASQRQQDDGWSVDAIRTAAGQFLEGRRKDRRMARGSAEIEFGIDRHGGHAEQPAARGGIVVTILRTGMMTFAMAVGGAVLVHMCLHLRMVVPVSTGLCVTGRMMHMQAELPLREAMRRMVASAICGDSGR